MFLQIKKTTKILFLNCLFLCYQIFIETIADAPYRLYIDWLTWVILYLLPDIPDMAHDDVVIAGIGFLPHNVINLFLAEHYSRMLCKKLQDFKLGIGKIYLLILPNYHPLNLVNQKTFEIQQMIIQI